MIIDFGNYIYSSILIDFHPFISKISISSEELGRRSQRVKARLKARGKRLMNILRPKNRNLYLFFIFSYKERTLNLESVLIKQVNKLSTNCKGFLNCNKNVLPLGRIHVYTNPYSVLFLPELQF